MTVPSPSKSEKHLDKAGPIEAGVLSILSDSIDCPLCAGRGKLARIEFFEKTGMREPSLIAELSAKQAVQSMHEKLWADFREQLGEQVTARTKELEKQLQGLETQKMGLEKDIESLHESRGQAIEQAKKEQELADQKVLSKDKQAVTDELNTLKGELAKVTQELDGARKQQALNTRDATEKIKDEEGALRKQLQDRIDQMNEALVKEQKSKVELENKLRRLEIEVDAKVAEARKIAVEEKDDEISRKSAEAEAIRQEVSRLKGEVELFPEKEKLARRAAIQDHEDKLRKVELSRDNALTERDRLQHELSEAQRKLEASKGKVEERTFEELIGETLGIWIENKSRKGGSGDFHVGLLNHDGENLKNSHLVIDNKDKVKVSDKDIEKLVHDAKKHKTCLAAMVLREDSSMRRKDRDGRFSLVDGVHVLFTTRDWFVRDLDLLRPLMRQQAEHGPDFLKRNVSVAAEVRSRLKAFDSIERAMELTAKHATDAVNDLRRWRGEVDDLCRTTIQSRGEASADRGEEE